MIQSMQRYASAYASCFPVISLEQSKAGSGPAPAGNYRTAPLNRKAVRPLGGGAGSEPGGIESCQGSGPLPDSIPVNLTAGIPRTHPQNLKHQRMEPTTGTQRFCFALAWYKYRTPAVSRARAWKQRAIPRAVLGCKREMSGRTDRSPLGTTDSSLSNDRQGSVAAHCLSVVPFRE